MRHICKAEFLYIKLAREGFPTKLSWWSWWFGSLSLILNSSEKRTWWICLAKLEKPVSHPNSRENPSPYFGRTSNHTRCRLQCQCTSTRWPSGRLSNLRKEKICIQTTVFLALKRKIRPFLENIRTSIGELFVYIYICFISLLWLIDGEVNK